MRFRVAKPEVQGYEFRIIAFESTARVSGASRFLGVERPVEFFAWVCRDKDKKCGLRVLFSVSRITLVFVFGCVKGRNVYHG